MIVEKTPYELETAINFRASDRPSFQDSKIFRTADATQFSKKDSVFLSKKIGIRYFIDLRSDREIEKYGPPIQLIEAGISWIKAPLTGYGNATISSLHPSTEDYVAYYKEIILTCQDCLKNIFKQISKYAQHPVMVGCHFGKDRTGLVIAFWLHLLGTQLEIIARDYSLTGQELIKHAENFQDKWRKRNISKDEYLPHFHTQENTIISLIEWVNTNFGGAETYLNEIGVTPQELYQIRKEYLHNHA